MILRICDDVRKSRTNPAWPVIECGYQDSCYAESILLCILQAEYGVSTPAASHLGPPSAQRIKKSFAVRGADERTSISLEHNINVAGEHSSQDIGLLHT